LISVFEHSVVTWKLPLEDETYETLVLENARPLTTLLAFTDESARLTHQKEFTRVYEWNKTRKSPLGNFVAFGLDNGLLKIDGGKLAMSDKVNSFWQSVGIKGLNLNSDDKLSGAVLDTFSQFSVPLDQLEQKLLDSRNSPYVGSPRVDLETAAAELRRYFDRGVDPVTHVSL
jgi:hypothetical protein